MDYWVIFTLRAFKIQLLFSRACLIRMVNLNTFMDNMTLQTNASLIND